MSDLLRRLRVWTRWHVSPYGRRWWKYEDDPTTAPVEPVEWPMNEGDIQDGGW